MLSAKLSRHMGLVLNKHCLTPAYFFVSASCEKLVVLSTIAGAKQWLSDRFKEKTASYVGIDVMTIEQR